MKFENLPNELIFDLFEYFDLLNLISIFLNLNTHFNRLLDHYNGFYYLNYRKKSKRDFHLELSRYHSKIISITIADQDETPNLPEQFFSRFSPLSSSFPLLQSLTIISIRSIDLLTSLIEQCQQLNNIRQLKLIQCQINPSISNLIWNLSKLTHLFLDGTLVNLSTRSNSIKYLSIKNSCFDKHSLNNLGQQTPLLTHLRISITIEEKCQVNFSSLIKLNLIFAGKKERLFDLLQSMMNLQYLTFQTDDFLIHGNEWQDLIENFLINLKKFHFKMTFKCSQNRSIKYQINEILSKYQTQFWINTHRQQFIRCHWNPSDPFQHVCLYSLPYVFQDFDLTNEFLSISTCLNPNDYWSYDHVNKLAYEKKHSSINFPIRFSHLLHLDLILPYDKNFLSTISSFDYLHTLDVVLLPNDCIYEQLQIILDHTPRLYLLRFSHLTDFDSRLFQLRNSSIRRLDFFTKESMLYNWYFDHEQCLTLARSSLGQQCQTLIIDVENRMNILDLILQMSNLQALTLHCKDDRWKLKTTNDELILWLNEHLPIKCDIIRHKNETSILQIWIR